jgi:hypothetical protein
MSDVLASIQPEAVLLTGLCNPQVVRTAQMADVAAIVLVRGKQPPAETIRLANEENVPLISTPYGMFEVCGRLHDAGLASLEQPMQNGPASVITNKKRSEEPNDQSENRAGPNDHRSRSTKYHPGRRAGLRAARQEVMTGDSKRSPRMPCRCAGYVPFRAHLRRAGDSNGKWWGSSAWKT